MPSSFLVALLSSFIATLGLGAHLLGVPRKSLIPGSAIGAIGYTLYWALMVWGGMSDPAAILIGSIVASLLAQLAAREMRMIASIFSNLAIVAFVPGLGLYRCMAQMAQGNTAQGLETGMSTMVSIVMIVLGLATGSFLFRLIFANRKPKDVPKG